MTVDDFTSSERARRPTPVVDDDVNCCGHRPWTRCAEPNTRDSGNQVKGWPSIKGPRWRTPISTSRAASRYPRTLAQRTTWAGRRVRRAGLSVSHASGSGATIAGPTGQGRNSQPNRSLEAYGRLPELPPESVRSPRAPSRSLGMSSQPNDIAAHHLRAGPAGSLAARTQRLGCRRRAKLTLPACRTQPTPPMPIRRRWCRHRGDYPDPGSGRQQRSGTDGPRPARRRPPTSSPWVDRHRCLPASERCLHGPSVARSDTQSPG